jgi:ActR/RegA family two-component response regulator
MLSAIPGARNLLPISDSLAIAVQANDLGLDKIPRLFKPGDADSILNAVQNPGSD